LFYLPPSVTAVGTAAFGLHADARGGNISAAEVGVFAEARVGLVKVLSSTAPESVVALSRALGKVRWVVRAFLEFGGRAVTPQQFFEWTVGDVERTLRAIPLDDEVVVELHNEPNLVAEGHGRAWRDASAFNQWYLEVLRLYRARLGGARFIFPGLSPGVSIPGVRQGHRSFLPACREAMQASDGVGIHVYWSNGYPMDSHPDAGLPLLREWVSMVGGQPVWVTEASRKDNLVSVETRAGEYVRFWRECRALPQVRGVAYFVASAAPGTFDKELWLVDGQSTGLAQLVRAR
jgi:hypothetical protein